MNWRWMAYGVLIFLLGLVVIAAASSFWKLVGIVGIVVGAVAYTAARFKKPDV